MDPNDILKFIVIGTGSLSVLITVTALAARFTLNRVVDAIARLREPGQSQEAVRMLERRMALLEQEVQSVAGLREQVARLAEAQEFQLRLAAPLPTISRPERQGGGG